MNKKDAINFLGIPNKVEDDKHVFIYTGEERTPLACEWYLNKQGEVKFASFNIMDKIKRPIFEIGDYKN